MKRHILFVDDSPSVLSGLRRMLHDKCSDWEMQFVPSAREALEAIAETAFDAIVSDVNMPGMDGFGLLLALQESEETRDIPVIILTGVDDHDLKRRALDLGATDLLTKPADREELIARIGSVLRLKAQQDELKTLNASLEQKVAERTRELEQLQQEIIWRMGKAAEYRDEETGNHVMRVAAYSRVLAEQLDLEREFVHRVFLTSPLHDIGKIGIPDNILLKAGELTTPEREIIERHCVIGAAILSHYPKPMQSFLVWERMNSPSPCPPTKNPILKMAAAIAMAHHERWDGSGYPLKLAGKEIPLEARIVALADTYDALSAARPYRPALPEDHVRQIMREESETHFDPAVYDAFEHSLDQFRTIQSLYADEGVLLVK